MKKKEPYNNSSTVFKAVRIRLVKTQSEMSVILKCHVQFVSNWERGKCLPPKKSMKRLFKLMTEQEVADYSLSYKNDCWAHYLDSVK